MFWKFWTHKEYLGTQPLMSTSSLHKFGLFTGLEFWISTCQVWEFLIKLAVFHSQEIVFKKKKKKMDGKRIKDDTITLSLG